MVSRLKQSRAFGIGSVLLSLVFWLPMTYAYIGMKYTRQLPLIQIPFGVVFGALILSAVCAILAALRGSRWWLLVAVSPFLALATFVGMIQG